MALELIRINTSGLSPEQMCNALNQKLENLVQQLNMKLLLFDDQENHIIETRKTILTVEQAQSEFGQVITNNIAAIEGNIYKIHGDLADYKKVVAGELTAVDGYIQTLRGDFADYKTVIAGDINAATGKITVLTGDLADFKQLVTQTFTAEDARIKTIIGDFADYKTIIAKDFQAATGRIDELSGNVASFLSGDFNSLKSDHAVLRELVFGSATGTQISTDFSNSVAALIGNGYIKDAMIDSLSFDKLSGFDINTTKFTVHSSDGKSQWKDNTILISDAARPRVQIGKDAGGDYNMYVWDAAGALMFDALGLTEKGIQREIIKDNMVAQDASINAAKLDIDSLFRVVNEDESHTLKSTKVYFDSEQQTLDLVFNSMTTNIAGAKGDAEKAQAAAEAAKTAADTANAAVTSAQTELEAAKTNLANVTTRVGATEEDVAAAQKAVATAQAAADKAKSDAAAANSAASKAQAAADTAGNKAQTALTQISAANGEISTLVQNMTSMGNELSATKTQSQQTADQFKWLVKSGSGATDFTLTDRVAALLSEKFDIDALTTFKNSAESGSQTVIDGGAIKANTLTADHVGAGSLAVGMDLMEYLFGTEGNDDERGRITLLNENIEGLAEGVAGFDEVLRGSPLLNSDGSVVTDVDGNPIYAGGIVVELDEAKNGIDHLKENTNKMLSQVFSELSKTPSREEMLASLNYLLERNTQMLDQYGSALNLITLSPLGGLVIKGVDLDLDENNNIQYEKRQKYRKEPVLDDEGNPVTYNGEPVYVHMPETTEDGKPVYEDDLSKVKLKAQESPYSVRINNKTFTINENDTPITTITGSFMYISDVEMTNSMRLGNYVYTKNVRDDGVNTLNFMYDPRKETNGNI